MIWSHLKKNNLFTHYMIYSKLIMYSQRRWMTSITNFTRPMMLVQFGLTMPLGSKWKSKLLLPTTTVCPALLPPYNNNQRTINWSSTCILKLISRLLNNIMKIFFRELEIIYLVNHRRPHSAFGAAKNHFIDPPNKKMLPALNFPG